MWQRGDSARGRAGSSAKRRPIAKFAFRFGSKTDTDGDGVVAFVPGKEPVVTRVDVHASLRTGFDKT